MRVILKTILPFVALTAFQLEDRDELRCTQLFFSSVMLTLFGSNADIGCPPLIMNSWGDNNIVTHDTILDMLLTIAIASR